MQTGIDALARTAMFSSVPAEGLNRIAARLRQRHYRKGEAIFEQGDPGNTLLILLSGEVKLTVPSPTGEDIILSLLATGDEFGELALLDGKPRSSAAVATEETDIVALHRDDFLELVLSEPDTTRAVLAGLATVIRQMNEKLADVAMLDVHGRMAKALMHLADRHGQVVPEGLRIARTTTIEELAALAALYRVEVARLMRGYQYEDRLRVEDNVITLRHVDSWRELAGRCP